jgi:predicted ATP-binding protein involved in virulence
MSHFICSIKIINLLNMHDILINLNNPDQKNLAVVGKNNVGKTLLLDNLQKCLDSIKNNHVAFIEDWISESEELLQNKHILENKLKFADAVSTVNLIKMQSQITDIALQELQSKLMQYRTDVVYCQFSNPDSIYQDFIAHKFLIIYFTENRNFIANVGEHDGYYKDFIAYVTQLKIQYFQIPILETNSMSTKDVIRQNSIVWLSNFEKCFADIIQDYDLQLNWNNDLNEFFMIDVKNSKKFSLLGLSKGHLAILGVVSRIVAKARENDMLIYDIKGIILIDEVELHLDINLQEKILPFLTKLFPLVQFIVTSHTQEVLKHVTNFVDLKL